MKTKFLLLFIILCINLLCFTACKKNLISYEKSESLSSNKEYVSELPDQDLLLLFTYYTCSEDEYHSAKILNINGEMIDVTDLIYDSNGKEFEDWISKLPDINQNNTIESVIPQKDMNTIYDFVNNSDNISTNKMINYSEEISDAGFYSMYILIERNNGNYEKKLLCTSGSTNTYVDDTLVIDFCTWMDSHHYFSMHM